MDYINNIQERIPNGAFLSASMDLAADTSFGSFGTKWFPSFWEVIGEGSDFGTGFMAGFVSLMGLEDFSVERKESEIFD
jgi:hypothetical protein